MYKLKNIFEFSKINEMRNKDVYKIMRPFFDETPEYVFKELFYAKGGFFKSEFIELIGNGADDEEIEDTFVQWADITWKKKVISINFNDFTIETQKQLKSRGMGSVHLKDVPNDEERIAIQKKLAVQNSGGKNEPVILLHSKKGYGLLEGWHRTMSILNLGSDGTSNYEKWDKVKINAWVGTGVYVDDLNS
jgi:hypothetical protein